MHGKTIARSRSVHMHVCYVSKGQLTSAQDARFWQGGSSLLPGLRPDSDSSRDFGSSEVYPRENWDILKKNEAAHPKSTVLSARALSFQQQEAGFLLLPTESRSAHAGRSARRLST